MSSKLKSLPIIASSTVPSAKEDLSILSKMDLDDLMLIAEKYDEKIDRLNERNYQMIDKKRNSMVDEDKKKKTPGKNT